MRRRGKGGAREGEEKYLYNLCRVHKEKLQQVESGLRTREADRDRMLSTRVDAMVTRRLASRDDVLDKLQSEHVKGNLISILLFFSILVFNMLLLLTLLL